jgi:histidine ammonia-lyase
MSRTAIEAIRMMLLLTVRSMVHEDRGVTPRVPSEGSAGTARGVLMSSRVG